MLGQCLLSVFVMQKLFSCQLGEMLNFTKVLRVLNLACSAWPFGKTHRLPLLVGNGTASNVDSVRLWPFFFSFFNQSGRHCPLVAGTGRTGVWQPRRVQLLRGATLRVRPFKAGGGGERGIYLPRISVGPDLLPSAPCSVRLVPGRFWSSPPG